jgi:hypothetical protein
VTKPPHPLEAALIPEPYGSRKEEVLGHARLHACPDPPGPDLHGPLRINFRGDKRCRIARAGYFGPIVGLAIMFMIRSHRINICSPSSKAKAEAPATPGVGISVRNTCPPEVMAEAAEASVLSPTRARGVPGDKTPLI